MQRDIEKAESVILKLNTSTGKKKPKIISNTKLRGIMGMVGTLFIQIPKEKRALTEDEQLLVDRFVVQLVYESGREESVKNFIVEADLIDRTKKVSTTLELRNLYHYLEALVAYHKFYVKERR